MNDEVQNLAEELVTLDREIDTALIKTIESRITEIEFGFLKNLDGKACFPLLKRFNGIIPFENFYDVFIDVLMGLFRNYNPGKGSFSTALSFQLNNRAKDCFKELKKKEKNISLDEQTELLGEEGLLIKTDNGFFLKVV